MMLHEMWKEAGLVKKQLLQRTNPRRLFLFFSFSVSPFILGAKVLQRADDEIGL